MTTKKIHISAVEIGHTIVHEGVMKTITKTNIKTGVNGTTLFGDSYWLGRKLVDIVLFKKWNKGSFTLVDKI